MNEISFGAWLRRQRKIFGFTQKQLAEKINCATITLRKLEAEQRRPSVQMALQLAQVLGIPSSEYASFLKFARGYRQFAPASAIAIDPWQSTLGSLVVELPPALASILGSKQNSLPRNGYLVDADSFWGKLPEPVQKSGENWMGELSPGALTAQHANVHMLMLIPVEVPAQLIDSLIHNQTVDQQAGIFSKIMTGI